MKSYIFSKKKKLLSLLLLLLSPFTIFSCGGEESDPGLPVFMVRYYGNGADSGDTREQKGFISTSVQIEDVGDFSKIGHRFTGWNELSNGSGKSYKPGDIYKMDRDLSLYAQWGKLCTVTFDSNGGTGTMAPQELIKGEPLKANSFSKPGENFIGWSLSAGGNVKYGDRALFNEEGDVTLYAVWETGFTLTFDPNGAEEGNILPLSGTGSVTLPTNKEAGSKFKKKQHIVEAWNTAADGSGTDYAPGASFTLSANTTLYAKWKRVIGEAAKYLQVNIPDQYTWSLSYNGTNKAEDAKKDLTLFPDCAPYNGALISKPYKDTDWEEVVVEGKGPDGLQHFWMKVEVAQNASGNYVPQENICYPLDMLVGMETGWEYGEQIAACAMTGKPAPFPGISIEPTGGDIVNDKFFINQFYNELFACTVKSSGDGFIPEKKRSGSLYMEWELWQHCFIADLNRAARTRWPVWFVAGHSPSVPGIGGQFRSVNNTAYFFMVRKIEVSNPNLTIDSEYPVRSRYYRTGQAWNGTTRSIMFYTEAWIGNRAPYTASSNSHWQTMRAIERVNIRLYDDDDVKAVPLRCFLTDFVVDPADTGYSIEIESLGDPPVSFTQAEIASGSVYFVPGCEMFCMVDTEGNPSKIVNFPKEIKIKNARAWASNGNTYPPALPGLPGFLEN